MAKRKITILIADDHLVVLYGMGKVFEKQKNMKLVGRARTCDETLLLADKLRPDVILLDVIMQGIGGIETASRIHAKHPNIKIIPLSGFADKHLIIGMLHAGASGYVLKNGEPHELLEAVKVVLTGKHYFSPAIEGIAMKEFLSGETGNSCSLGADLTDRDRQVIRLTAEGMSAKRMASQLKLSERTIERQRKQIMEKLGFKSMADLIKYAIREGLTSIQENRHPA